MANFPYVPLFAGLDLVRRSGSLTTFPPDMLLGNLPRPGRFQYRAPPELVGQPVQFGMSNAVFEQYQLAAQVDPNADSFWPFAGFTPGGVVDEGPGYLRMRWYREGYPGSPMIYTPGSFASVYNDASAGIVGETFSSALTVSGMHLAPTGVVYPSGTYDTLDAYLAACGMPTVPNDDSEVFRHQQTLEWITPVFGATGSRVTMTGYSAGSDGVDLSTMWASYFTDKPYPTGIMDPTNTVQGLYGNISNIYIALWSAVDSELTPTGVEAKALLRLMSPSQPIGILSVIGVPFREPSTLNAGELAYLQIANVTDANLLPGSIPRQSIGFVGPSYKVIRVSSLRESKIDGVWVPSVPNDNIQNGLTAANTVERIRFDSSNQLVTQLFLPTAQVEQVYIPGT